MGQQRLPDFLIIGAMKCGTTALHDYLGRHPEIAMSVPKELNYFTGPEVPPDEPAWGYGNWWRGTDWYVNQFPGVGRIRGEASPGYTSPDHPEAAARIAQVVPDARLLYLVRDPLDRAVSQYLHHRRDGDETRAIGEALLDPDSQYVSRSRYVERLQPFLERFDRRQIRIVEHRDLRDRRRRTLAQIFTFVGADPTFWSPAFEEPRHTAGRRHPEIPDEVRTAFLEAVSDDQAALRRLIGQDADTVLQS